MFYSWFVVVIFLFVLFFGVGFCVGFVLVFFFFTKLLGVLETVKMITLGLFRHSS